MKYNFCTLFDKNYLTRGLALHSSLLNHSQPFMLWILCMDNSTFNILTKLKLDSVTLINLQEFEDKELLKIKPTRTPGEYCWTCTPSLPLYIFRHYPKIKMISYLDSDLYFYSSPEAIFKEIGEKSIMIIPHRFTSGKLEKEKQAGIYNVSMLAFRRDKNGLKCLRWWRERCLEWCFNRYEDGKIGDQKYLDQFPKLFKGIHELQHKGANVASWNIGQYKLSIKGGIIYIDDFPLVFFHFLGLKIYSPRPLLPPVAPRGYGDWSKARVLIYNQYFDKIYELTKSVRNYFPKFSDGFAPRENSLMKEVLVDAVLRFYSRFH